MKTKKLFWGLGFLLAAALIILDAVGIIPSLLSAVGKVSIFSLILGLLLLSFAIERLCKGKVADIFFPLAFIFMLFEKNIAVLCGLEDENIINNWLVLLIALLLHAGFAILLPSPHTRKRHRKCATSHENAFNSSAIYIDCETFTSSTVTNKLGECTVHFRGIDKYQGGQTLTVENSLGSMTVNVPVTWTAVVDVDNTMGSLDAPMYSDNGGPVLYIKGENHLGSIEIIYV